MCGGIFMCQLHRFCFVLDWSEEQRLTLPTSQTWRENQILLLIRRRWNKFDFNRTLPPKKKINKNLKVKSLDFKLPDSRRITFEEMGVFFGGDGEILKQEHRETFCPEFQQWWIIIKRYAILITTIRYHKKMWQKHSFQQWWIIVKKMQHQLKLRKFTLAT